MELSITAIPHEGELLLCARLGEAVVGAANYDLARGCFELVWTHPQARRRGIAAAMYAEIEGRGLPVSPSATLSEAGMAFWRGRGVDPGRCGSRLVAWGRCPEDDIHGTVDITEALEAWDAARRPRGP